MPAERSQPNGSQSTPALTNAPADSRDLALQNSAANRPSQDIHRAIPSSPDAEKGVLSCMLQAPNECVGDAMIRIGRDQFYNRGRQILFDTILELYDQGKPVEVISITETLQSRNQLDFVGGASELVEIFSFVPSPAHFQYYAEVLKNKFVLRRIIESGSTNIEKAFHDVPDVASLLDGFERDVFAIRESLEHKDDIKPMREHLMDAIHEIEELFRNKGSTQGIPTGYGDLDKMTNGLHAGDIFIIAARPSMGKTSFAMNIVENVALQSKAAVAVFSLEMGADQLTQRLLCAQAKISMEKVRSGLLSEKRDFPRIQHAAARLAECKIYIDDTPSLSIMALRAKARRMKKQFGIDLIAIDYLQLMRSESKRAQENRQQEVAEISAGLKALAKELRIPIIVLAQLNRSPETRTGSNRPRLSDLRESGSIEQDADVVGLLMRDEYYAESDEEREETAGRSTLIIGKNRNGATGDVPLTFRKELMRFESRARDDDDE